jgi:hypothetical protein
MATVTISSIPLPIPLFEDNWRLAADDLCRDVAQDMFTEEEGGEAGGRLEFQVYTLFGDTYFYFLNNFKSTQLFF